MADQAVISSFPSMQQAHFPSAISQQTTLFLTDSQVGNTKQSDCLVRWYMCCMSEEQYWVGVCLSLCVLISDSSCCVREVTEVKVTLKSKFDAYSLSSVK